MATYTLSYSEDDNEGQSTDREKTKPPVEAHFREVAATGRFVRFIVWDNNEWKELARANEPKASGSPNPEPKRITEAEVKNLQELAKKLQATSPSPGEAMETLKLVMHVIGSATALLARLSLSVQSLDDRVKQLEAGQGQAVAEE